MNVLNLNRRQVTPVAEVPVSSEPAVFVVSGQLNCVGSKVLIVNTVKEPDKQNATYTSK